MKKLKVFAIFLLASFLALNASSQTTTDVQTKADEAKAKSDSDAAKRAGDWTSALNLNNAAKEARVKEVIFTHLKAIRDWNNEHPATTVPAGINPATGNKLSELDRQVIAISAMPKSIHENLMSGLRKDLTEEQVEMVLDKYTVGKVAFTLAGYKSIVPNLTPIEETEILKNLKLAREQAVDYKNMKQISAIFEIYKTKCEQYLNANGRNWHQMYKDYTNEIKAKKLRHNKHQKLNKCLEIFTT